MEESKIVSKEESDFDRFWKVYPPRKGDRAKTPARILFEKAVKSGTDPADIINGARGFALEEAKNSGTVFIMQAQRWLRNKRWLDFKFEPSPFFGVPITRGNCGFFIQEGTEAWDSWQSYLLMTKGKRSPIRNFGWWFPSELPPK